ncbi:Hypothetical protein A7982_04117 [Minicystis rosea]|nr:Hypothetical protein A7982_04117 [Minicystis rosea]
MPSELLDPNIIEERSPLALIAAHTPGRALGEERRHDITPHRVVT